MHERTRPAPSPRSSTSSARPMLTRPAWTASPPPLASSSLSRLNCRSARPPPCSRPTLPLPPASSATASLGAYFSPVSASRPDAPGSSVEHELGCSERMRAALRPPRAGAQAPGVGRWSFPTVSPVGFYSRKGAMIAAVCGTFVPPPCAACTPTLCSLYPHLVQQHAVTLPAACHPFA